MFSDKEGEGKSVKLMRTRNAEGRRDESKARAWKGYEGRERNKDRLNHFS